MCYGIRNCFAGDAGEKNAGGVFEKMPMLDPDQNTGEANIRSLGSDPFFVLLLRKKFSFSGEKT